MTDSTSPTPKRRNALRERFALNNNAMDKGVVLRNFPDGITVTVRSSKCYDVRRLNLEFTKKNRQAVAANGGLIDPELQDQTDIEILAQSIVVGWSGIVGDDGEDIPFTVENARKLFTELPEFTRELIGYANNSDTFRAAAFEEAVVKT